MNFEQGTVERREHKRFNVKKGIFAVLGTDNFVLGQIKNISMRGLAFEFPDTGVRVAGSTEMEIFSKIYDYYLKKIPIKIIEDYEVERNVAFSSLPIRRLSIQFGKISSAQRLLLDHFLQNYTNEQKS